MSIEPIPDGTDAAAPRGALSPSRANDYLSCPLKFRFRTIDRLPEPPSAAASRGTLVHGALQHLFALPPADRSAEAATGALRGLWTDMLERHPELAELDEAADAEAWLDAAAELVNTYFRLEDPRRFEPEACEVRLEVIVAGSVPTRGFVDRLDRSPDGRLRIVDYKTGRAPRADYVDEAIFQLKFYALMLWRLRGVIAARLRLIYLGDGQIVEHTPTEQGLISLEERLARLWQDISTAKETGHFPPRRSRLCDWCSFRAICPEFGGTPPPYPHSPGL